MPIPLTIGDEVWTDLLRTRDVEQYQIAAPVWFRWQTSSGDWREGKGTTRHISADRLFVLAYPVPVPGASITVRIEIPPRGLLRRPIVIRGKGTVTRLEPDTGQPIGFDAMVMFDNDW